MDTLESENHVREILNTGGDLDLALTLITEVLATQPSAGAMRLQAMVLEGLGRTSEAIEPLFAAYRALLANPPRNMAIYDLVHATVALAKALSAAVRSSEAIRAIDDALAIVPEAYAGKLVVLREQLATNGPLREPTGGYRSSYPPRCMGVSAVMLPRLLGLVVVVAACSSPTAVDGNEPDGSLRVLFVGNSYVDVNDLPAMLSRIAATTDVAPLITVDSIAPGGAAFMDHAASADTLARIEEGGWTHVVLQNQSVQPVLRYFNDFRDHLGDDEAAAKVLADRVVATGATPVWYATWARAASDVDGFYATYGTNPTQMQDLLTSEYARYAEASPGSVVACVGEAFRRALAEHPEIILHQADGSHPTVAGTYLAASTLYVALTGHAVPERSEVPAELDAADAGDLRALALGGSTCAGYRAPAIVQAYGDTFLAGSPQRRFVYLENRGDSSAGVADGGTLMPPFTWSSGQFPGYSDPRIFPKGPPCGALLGPRSTCTVSVTFSGATAGTSTVSFDLTNAYATRITTTVVGTTSDQPLLELVRDPSTTTADPDFPLGSSPDVAVVSALRGETAVFHLVLTNVGGAPATPFTGGSVGATSFNDGIWSWGPTLDPQATFPGGTGVLAIDGHTLPYCTDPLAVGATCVVTASFTPPLTGTPANGNWSKQLRVVAPFTAQSSRARVSLYGYALN